MKEIATFLNAGKYAVAGVSRNPKKFGHVVFKTLLKKGMDVLPVNPNDLAFDDVGRRCACRGAAAVGL